MFIDIKIKFRHQNRLIHFDPVTITVILYRYVFLLFELDILNSTVMPTYASRTMRQFVPQNYTPCCAYRIIC